MSGKRKNGKPTAGGIILRIAAGLLLAAFLIAAGYLSYVFLSYSRLEDNIQTPLKGTASRGDAVSVNTPYTVVTQNLGFGAYTPDFTFFMDGGRESWGRSREAVVAAVDEGIDTVLALDPDFILLQEVDTDSTRSYHVNQEDQIAARAAGYMSAAAVNYHSAFLMYPFRQPHGASNSELLTLSRYTITSSLRRSLPISESVSKILDLDRCYSVSRIAVDNGMELVIYNVHTSAYGNSDEIRTAQMTMLFNDMQAEYDRGNYVVCGGDFNHDFTGTSVRDYNESADVSGLGWAAPFPIELLPADFVRCTDYTSAAPTPTCRNDDVPYPGCMVLIVDGFLVSKNVTVTVLDNVWTAFSYSDHTPVVMTFTLNG